MSAAADPLRKKLYDALMRGERKLVRTILEEHPAFISTGLGSGSLLHVAASYGQTALCKDLHALGCDINAVQRAGTLFRSPLINAVGKGHLETARWLLEQGARVDNDRYLISAICNTDNSLAMLELLVEFGADIHQVFQNEMIGEPMNALSAAIDRDKQDCIDYLRSLGAVMPNKTPPKSSSKPHSPSSNKRVSSTAEEVVAYFQDHFGPVSKRSLIEIVPDDLPVTIHHIPATPDRQHITLFTTGLSSRPMKTPQGSEQFRYAELFIQLPAKWPFTKESLGDPNTGWPIDWLRKTAKYPHQHRTWLGGPLTVIDNEDPPQRLAPKVPFTCLMLLAEHRFESQVSPTKGETIQLFRMVPLYTEERNLEHRDGPAALMRAFDAANVPFVVDLKRKNVAD